MSTDKPEPDPDAIIDAMARLLGLDVKPEYRPSVATNITVTSGLARLVLDFPLGDHIEPAAVFRP